jgi:hypothetical protein
VLALDHLHARARTDLQAPRVGIARCTGGAPKSSSHLERADVSVFGESAQLGACMCGCAFRDGSRRGTAGRACLASALTSFSDTPM